MTIKPIRSEADYDAALAEIDRLMGVTSGTPESDRLEVLVTLVERYEAERWSIDAPDPISVIHHVMEARGLRQRDLAALIGSQSHASEIRRPPPPALPRHDPTVGCGMESSGRCAGT